ncbi:Multidrug resistance protein MdtH [subsurface metagenome]
MNPFITDKDPRSSRIFSLNPNVFFLGLVSFLTDVSSEMIFTLIPLFLCNVLGAATTVVGLVGGLSESIDAIFRIFSGWFSDKVKKRKPLAVLGYSISTIAKPFMYLASTWGVVLAVRFGDRIGKGIRTSPRDALVADSVSAGERGKGFGLHRAMDTLGAVLGLAIAAIIVYLVQGGGLELGLMTYQWLVLVGVIPAVLAVLVLLIFVHERTRKPLLEVSGSEAGMASTGHSGLFRGWDTRFKLFLAIMAVFTLGNSSDFFVILRAQNLEAPLIQVILMLVLFNATYAAISLPAGMLSDRLGRKRVITLGWFIYALVYLGFAVASSIWQIWLLFACYGIYYGIVEGVARAFVADLVPEQKRGTAYGLYHGVVGLTLLPASLIAGWLWDAISPATPFFFGAALAFLAMLGMMALIRE